MLSCLKLSSWRWAGILEEISSSRVLQQDDGSSRKVTTRDYCRSKWWCILRGWQSCSVMTKLSSVGSATFSNYLGNDRDLVVTVPSISSTARVKIGFGRSLCAGSKSSDSTFDPQPSNMKPSYAKSYRSLTTSDSCPNLPACLQVPAASLASESLLCQLLFAL